MTTRTSFPNCIAPLLFAASAALFAQSTQGIIHGQVRTSKGAPLAGTWVFYCRTSPESIEQRNTPAQTNAQGFYALPFLTPGTYRLRAQTEESTTHTGCFPLPTGHPASQAQEKHDLILPVAGRLAVDFDLRPASDVSDENANFLTPTGMVVRYFSADARKMKSASIETGPASDASSTATLSYVLDAAAIANLPLNGRDLFSALVVLPGVTSEGGTGRGLGLAVNGARSTSSNFLLDGLENNNFLTTGPLTTLAPEAAQEYRISTNNFSAEFGRAAGFIANAVTRPGTQRNHGLAYANLQNEVLNANAPPTAGVQTPRRPLRQSQWGGQWGGPLRRERLLASFALDSFRSRDRLNPTSIPVLSPSWATAPKLKNTPIFNLLRNYPLQPGTLTIDPNDFNATLAVEQPVSLDRLSGVARLDALSSSGATRLMGRLSTSRTARPDFIWSPYPGFNSQFTQPDVSAAFNLTSVFNGGRANELRAGWSRNALGWNRPHSDIPTITAADGTRFPGSPAAYEYNNVSRNIEINDSLQWITGRHILRAGGGLLVRNMDTRLTYARDGQVTFENLALDLVTFNTPSSIRITSARQRTSPQYDRRYRYWQSQAFFEDTIRAHRHLTLNLGIRYESFGVPTDVSPVGTFLVQPQTPRTLAPPPASGNQPLLPANNRNFAGRFGASYAFGPDSRTVLRSAYGLFYDRPFDNLWQNLANNNIVSTTTTYESAPGAYLSPPNPSQYVGVTLNSLPYPLYLDPNWRTGYAHSYFTGIEHRLTPDWSFSANASGSTGRRLITSDIIGRPQGSATYIYRAPQGESTYSALSLLLRRQNHGGAWQAAYTWSHSIDNQSDALAGDFFDLAYKQTPARATFSLPGDTRIDRGNSDFDQRHNLVFYAFQQLPAFVKGPIGKGWTVGALGAVRSGLPFTVTGAAAGQVYPALPDLIAPALVYDVSSLPAVPGARRLLNRAAFRQLTGGTAQGNLGRNSLHGPGFYTIDLTLARSFAVPRLGEAGRLTVRADAFNFLNHLNLGQPNSNLGDPLNFGIAAFGRTGTPPSFPALSPLDESPRRVQLIFRLSF